MNTQLESTVQTTPATNQLKPTQEVRHNLTQTLNQIAARGIYADPDDRASADDIYDDIIIQTIKFRTHAQRNIPNWQTKETARARGCGLQIKYQESHLYNTTHIESGKYMTPDRKAAKLTSTDGR